jgi:hypothetical protein
MFDAPRSVKAVSITMRSPQSWGYFGINSAALVAEHHIPGWRAVPCVNWFRHDLGAMEFMYTAAMELIGRLHPPGRTAACHGCPSGAAALSFVLRPQLHTICRELCVCSLGMPSPAEVLIGKADVKIVGIVFWPCIVAAGPQLHVAFDAAGASSTYSAGNLAGSPAFAAQQALSSGPGYSHKASMHLGSAVVCDDCASRVKVLQ